MSRKTGLNKAEQVLLKKHVDAGSSKADITKVFKMVKSEPLAAWIKHFSEKASTKAAPAKTQVFR